MNGERERADVWCTAVELMPSELLNLIIHTHTHTHTHTQTQPFYGSLDSVRDNLVSRYQKKHSPTHTYRGLNLIISFQ